MNTLKSSVDDSLNSAETSYKDHLCDELSVQRSAILALLAETYLRVWAELLSCSIVSVEYSLAPENSFPRPTEVLYTHVYIISNAAQLGWSGEKVFMIGDSASGNLVISVISKLV
uniref:Alpha/beta hydrolase fold-3 domain-containing protein n=1 Tax=Wuchereria bancrofti TaxID=6293 RepID=A0AAF5RT38_WUCBA